jgi:outer membrane protein
MLAVFVRIGIGSALPASLPPGLSLAETVRLTLAHDPNVALGEAQVDSARGARLVAAGAFDAVVTQSVTAVETAKPGPGDGHELQSTLSVSQPLRSGLTVTPSIDLDRQDGGVPGSAPGNQGTVAFTLRQPLLRGRGREVVTAAEIAAERELTAAYLDQRQRIAERLFAVSSQYWTAKANEQNLDILRIAERSSRELFETTRKLIEADQTPAAELVQVEANLAANESARLGGERALFEARQTLGREIGLTAEEIAALPSPADPFPTLTPSRETDPAAAAAWAAAARDHRDDLLAARERQAASAARLKAAENALLPGLDLVLAPSYTGLDAGSGIGPFFSPLVRNVPGLSSVISLSLSWPTANHRALGSRLQAEAALRQAALAGDLIGVQIGADVGTALEAVGKTAEQLARARDAVRLFERAVGNEEKKLQAGSSTLLDLFSQRDRLTAARQNEVSAALALALAILRLRLETGTLLAPGGEARAAVDPSRLVTLPSQAELPR